jgi:hypothetical protein
MFLVPPGTEPSLAPPPALTMQRAVTVDPRFGFHSNEPSSFHAKSLVPYAPATFNTRSTTSQGSTMTPSMSTTAANLGSRSRSNGPFHFRATPAAREDGMLQKAIAPALNVQHQHIIDPSLGLDPLPGKKPAGCQTTVLIPRAADHVPRLVNQNDLTNDRANLANANRESSNGGHLESGDDNRSSDGDDNPDSNDSNDNSADNNDDDGDDHYDNEGNDRYDNEGDNTNEEHGNYNEFGGS